MNAESVLCRLRGRVVSVTGGGFHITGYLDYSNYFYEIQVYTRWCASATVRFCEVDVERILDQETDHDYEQIQGHIFLKSKLTAHDKRQRKIIAEKAQEHFRRMRESNL